MSEYRLLNILMTLFSTQVVKTYLTSFHNCKKNFTFLAGISWGIYFIFQYLTTLTNAASPLLVLIINIILVFFICKSSYHISLKNALFLAGSLLSVWMIVEVAIGNLLLLISIEESDYFFIVGSVISKLIMYILVHIFKRFHKPNLYTDLPFHYWLQLFLIPFATVYIIHNTYRITTQSNNFFFSITTILMLLINYIAFDVYDHLGNNIEIERKNFAYIQQIDLCNRQAAEREAAYQETKRVRHDLNEYLIDLKATIQSKEYDKAEEKINTILQQNQIYRNEIARSGNLVIDSLINYKYSLALKKNITMECYIFVPNSIPYDGSDLCIILGNLLDNAIEAVVDLPISQRHIDLSITQIKGSLCIIVQNSYHGEICTDSDGHLTTHKKDYKNHGIGLSSVQRSVDKYNGELKSSYTDNVFKTTVLLYPSAP